MTLTSRIVLWILVIAAIGYALVIGTFGVIDIVMQGLGGGILFIDVPVDSDTYGQFTSVGTTGVTVGGLATSATLAVPGPLNPDGVGWDAVVLHALGSVLVIVTHVTLALCAARLARGLAQGRPFARTVSNSVVLAAISLLAIGTLSQVVQWIARVVILDQVGISGFSRAFAFDPLVVTVALALALIAVAFRLGTRMQRDTEGLV